MIRLPQSPYGRRWLAILVLLVAGWLVAVGWFLATAWPVFNGP